MSCAGHSCLEGTSLQRNWKSAATHSLTCVAASRATTRVEVRPSQANAVKAIEGMAWQVRMRIIEAKLAAFSGQPKREFLPPVLRVTETRQQKRIELLGTLTSMGHLISRRWCRREICHCARCGRAGCLQRWKLELTTCTAVLARHDDRWVEESTIRVSIRGAATMKTRSATVEHLMLRWSKVTGTNRVGTTRQKEEYHTNKLVLGTGVVHHSHETWLLRGIKFCGKCVAWRSSAPRLLIKPCTYLANTRACDLRRLSRGQEPSDTPLVPRRMYISTPDQGDPGVDAAISRGVC